jgi:S1-C subfamily serine protease
MIDEGFSLMADWKRLTILAVLLAGSAVPGVATAQGLSQRPIGIAPTPSRQFPANRKLVMQRPVSAPVAPSPAPVAAHPAVVRIYVVEKGSQSLGSGTLIDVREPYALVVTNWHVIREAAGEISVVFPDGFRSAARVVQYDADWDLAALSIWKPNIAPVKITTEPPKPGDILTIAGYGSDGTFRAASGACTQYLSPSRQHPHEIVELAATARQGDSGGPIFNTRGELAGVLFGSVDNTTSGSYGPRVLKFLEPLLKSGAEVTAPPGSAPPADAPIAAAAVAKLDAAPAAPPGAAIDDQLRSLNPPAPPQTAAPLGAVAADDPALSDEAYQIEHTPLDALLPTSASSGGSAAASSGLTLQDFLGRTPIEQGKAALSIVGLFALLTFVMRFGREQKQEEHR